MNLVGYQGEAQCEGKQRQLAGSPLPVCLPGTCHYSQGTEGTTEILKEHWSLGSGDIRGHCCLKELDREQSF